MNTGTGNVGLKCSEKLDAVHSNKNSSFKFWWFSEVNETAFSLIFSEKRTTFQGIPIFFLIHFHFICLPYFSEIQQFFDFMETFPVKFHTVCSHFELFVILVEWKVHPIGHNHIKAA